jgi:hypothetical protein
MEISFYVYVCDLCLSVNILYEFEFEDNIVYFGRFKYILNLFHLNSVACLKVVDTINASLVLVGLSHMTQKIH